MKRNVQTSRKSKKLHFTKNIGNLVKVNRSILILIALLFTAAVLFLKYSSLGSTSQTAAINPINLELSKLAGNTMSFPELKKYFTILANKNGAPLAYEVLKKADIPLNTDLHLLGHVVGEILYKQKGARGIEYCTKDLRNACSHSIVVGLLLEKGEKALPEISDACRRAPGGKGAYTMCFHGLGHGVLSYTNFDLPKTVKLCEKTGTKKYNFAEYSQCVGGAMMEIISGGDHDKKTWSMKRKEYLLPNDPLYACRTLIPKEAKEMCYVYTTPYLMEAAGMNMEFPDPEYYKNAFSYCSTIPDSENANKSMCYGGFGKEFVVFAQNRDVRKITEMNSLQLSKVHDWCKLAENEMGVTSCISHALSSLYWGGENNPKAAILFCTITPDEDQKEQCFSNLFKQVSYYIRNPDYKNKFCLDLPKQYMSQCKNQLSRN